MDTKLKPSHKSVNVELFYYFLRRQQAVEEQLREGQSQHEERMREFERRHEGHRRQQEEHLRELQRRAMEPRKGPAGPRTSSPTSSRISASPSGLIMLISCNPNSSKRK